MTELIELAVKHGPFAVMLVALCAYHFWWSKQNRKDHAAAMADHQQERKEWRDSHETLQKETSSVVKENNEALRELTKVIAESNNHHDRCNIAGHVANQ